MHRRGGEALSDVTSPKKPANPLCCFNSLPEVIRLVGSMYDG